MFDRSARAAELLSWTPVLFYDEGCGVCRRFVAMALRADRAGRMRIAPLKGEQANALRVRHPKLAEANSAFWLPASGEPLVYSDAILSTLEYLGGAWRLLAATGKLVPRSARDWVYRSFASNRKYFGWLSLPAAELAALNRTLAPDAVAPTRELKVDRSTLATYLMDHLAGSVAALELVERLGTVHAATPLGKTVNGLLTELQGEQAIVRELLASLDATESTLANSVAWLGEKFSRLKIGPGTDDASGLMLFEALELLSVGFWGRRSLWRALAHLEQHMPGTTAIDCGAMASRAEAQLEALERLRLDAAIVALTLP